MTRMVTIERLKIEEVYKLKELLSLAIFDAQKSSAIDKIYYTGFSSDFIEKELGNRDKFINITKDNADIIGFIRATLKKEKVLFINNLFVRESHQNRGIAKALINGLLKDAGRLSSSIRVDVDNLNIKAIGFYNKCRFKKIASRQISTEGTMLEIVTMEKLV